MSLNNNSNFGKCVQIEVQEGKREITGENGEIKNIAENREETGLGGGYVYMAGANDRGGNFEGEWK